MKLRKALLLSMTLILACTASFAEDVIRVGVLRFEAKADGISQRNADSITDELTRMLANSYSIAIIDRSNLEAIAREQRMSLAGLIDPRTATQLGHLAGIQYLITGAITHCSITENIEQSDSSEFWDSIAKKNRNNSFLRSLGTKTVKKIEQAEVRLDLRIIDVNTQEVVLSMAETGKAARTTEVRADKSGGGQANVENISLRDSAVSDAVARIGQRIKEAVAGEYPQVLRVNGGEIIISLGANSGAKVGNLYKISLEGEDILDTRGKVIGKTTTPIAIVRVNEVKNDYSIVSVIKKGGNPSNIQRGDRVEASSSGEANDLIKRKAFLDRRPRKTLEDSGLEGAELDRRLKDINENTNASHTPTPIPSTVPDVPDIPDKPIAASSLGNSYVQSGSATRGTKLENRSDKATQVIASYGISDNEKRSLMEQHKRAEKMKSRDEKFDRYTEIFRSCPSDYFAAYQAAKIAFEIGKNARTQEWAEKALAVNPEYTPAKKLRQAAINRMK